MLITVILLLFILYCNITLYNLPIWGLLLYIGATFSYTLLWLFSVTFSKFKIYVTVYSFIFLRLTDGV